MDILLHKLKHGDSYTAIDEQGDQHQVLRAPTKITRQAADLIQKLASRLEYDQNYINQLTKERDQLVEELSAIQNTNNSNIQSDSTSTEAK